MVADEVAVRSALASALLNVFTGDLEEMGASVLSCEKPQTGARVRDNTHGIWAAVQRDAARLR